MPKPHSAALRQGRISTFGQPYLVTTATCHRRPVFHDLTAARLCIGALRQQQEQGAARTLAFVLMPDHLHWLVELQSAPLERLLHSVKRHAAREVNRLLGLAGPLWQAGYHDHALRREEDLREVARYIVANPVRAGLVRRAWDYPHWDAIWVGESDQLH